MSPKTVMHHSGRIDATLGVWGRAEAVVSPPATACSAPADPDG
jgi:hypothetical protein